MTVSVGKQRVLYILLVFQKGIISSITISLQRISFEKTKWDETFNQNLKSCNINSLSCFFIELQLVETLALNPSNEGGEETNPAEGDNLAHNDGEDIGHPHVHVHGSWDTGTGSVESYKEEQIHISTSKI